MKLKHYLILPTLALCPLATAEPVVTNNHAAQQVDLDGTSFTYQRLDQDLAAATEYLELIIKIARDSGEDVPEKFNVQETLKLLGLHGLKAYAHSSKFHNDAWHNKTYLEIDSHDKGLFYLLGEKNTAFTVTHAAPAGADLVYQAQLDLRQIPEALRTFANLVGDDEDKAELESFLKEMIPETKMTIASFLGKTKLTLNVMASLDQEKKAQVGPFQTSTPHLAIRIDGLNSIISNFDIPALFEENGLPLETTEENGDTFYTLHDEDIEELAGYDPIIFIDQKNNQAWIASDPDYLKSCRNPDNTLANSPEFQAAWKDMPQKGNHLFYLSKQLVDELHSHYKQAVKEDLFGEDFEKARPLADKIVKDLTRTKHGYGFALSKDDHGIAITGRSPVPSWMSDVLAIGALYGTSMASQEIKIDIEEELKDE